MSLRSRIKEAREIIEMARENIEATEEENVSHKLNIKDKWETVSTTTKRAAKKASHVTLADIGTSIKGGTHTLRTSKEAQEFTSSIAKGVTRITQ